MIVTFLLQLDVAVGRSQFPPQLDNSLASMA